MYSNNPIYATLVELIEVIARDETNGDCKAALADVIAATAEEAIKAYGVLKEKRGAKLIDYLRLQEIPPWVWERARAGKARIDLNNIEISVNVHDAKTNDPITQCYYGIRFEWAWINIVWPEPKAERQLAPKKAPDGFEKFSEANHRRRPGPRPAVRTRIAAAMRTAVTDGKISLAELRDMKQEAMKAQFGASAETCRIARAAVLAEFDDNPPAPIAAK